MKRILTKYRDYLFLAVIFSIMILYCCWPMVDYYVVDIKVVKVCLFIVLFFVSMISSLYIARKLCQDWVKEGAVFNQKEKEGLYLVRTLACILVITVHYIIRQNYYGLPAEGLPYFMVTFIRWISQCCCPLFMILSGYFLCKRGINRKHYLGLFHLLSNYIVISIIHLFYLGIEQVTIDKVKGLCNLNEMWYINMYFGLFLLIPFLNILWSAIDANKKILLLILLVLLGSFASVTNFWWTNYWNSLYPILYYYIGVWFRDKEFKINFSRGIFLLILMFLFETIYTYYIQPGEVFDWIVNFGGYSSGYNALPTVIASCLIFLLLKDIRIKNRIMRVILKKISQSSLEIYLLLCMFLDEIIFSPIWRIFAPKIGMVGVYFVLVPVEVFVATILGIVLNKVLDKLEYGLLEIIRQYLG